MEDVEFNIKVKMNERWADDFCSLLRYMEICGNIGRSAMLGFYADGDGDFRPKFSFDRDYNKLDGYEPKEKINVERYFDAG